MTRSASEVGKSSGTRGKVTERAVAKEARPWWPHARRSRDNGSTISPDSGDLAGMADDRIFWSVKADRKIRYPGTFAGFMADARFKARPTGRMPILIERRDGTANPLHWWAHLWLPDLAEVTTGRGAPPPLDTVPARLRVDHLFWALAMAGLTDTQPAITTGGSS